MTPLRSLTLLLASLLSLYLLSRLAESLVLQDWSIYWKATEQFVLGKNPYSLPMAPEYLEGTVGGGFHETTNVVLKAWCPPHTFAVLAPIGWLTLSQAKLIYLLALLVIVPLTVYLSFNLSIGKHAPAIGVPNPLLLIPIGPLYEAIYWGGVGFFVLAPATLSLWLLERERPFLAGYVWLLGLVKLQLAALYLGYMILRSLAQKRLAFPLGVLSALGTAHLIILLLNPDSLRGYRELDMAVPWLYSSITWNLATVLRTGNTLSFNVSYLPSCILSLSILTLAFRRNGLSPQALYLLFPFSLFLGPYSWLHDYLLATPSLCALAALASSSSAATRAVVSAVILSFHITSLAYSAGVADDQVSACAIIVQIGVMLSLGLSWVLRLSEEQPQLFQNVPYLNRALETAQENAA